MKLYYANTSPYARKARIALREAGLEARVEEVFQNPFEESPALAAANPLGKVPCLVTREGRALYDSPVICAWLAALAPDVGLIPDGTWRWQVLTGEALADGILDAAFALVMERRRPAPERSAAWMARWEGAIARAILAAETDHRPFEGPISVAQIALGAALGYLDFRLHDLAWREDAPGLAAWYSAFSQRPSMLATRPTEG